MLAALLKMMSDGQFHSGESLGKTLGVSRAAVWKSLRRLEEDGYPIQRVRGKGYRVPRGATLLNLDEIISAFPGEPGADIQWQLLGTVDSTNAQLMSRLSMDNPRPLACIAEQQSAGKGRRGRDWVSPYGQNIYLSLALPFSGGAQRLEGLSLLVGLVLVETLEAGGFSGCALKWPNDVLLDGRKLAGILIEIAGDLTSDCVAVIGVGVNVLMNDADAAIDQAWTSLLLSRQGGTLNRNLLIAEFIRRLLSAVEAFRAEGFAPYVNAWERRDAWRGLPVCVRSGTTSIEGVELGVDARGALRLGTVDGEVLLNGGEVSLRLKHDS
ncbi:BirA family transcriptional regulator, biotin operon repressor / biotin-[acetyl-CoA-carboxylase] ligase [Halopseudomonas litoralis]|uniref:Bifunctional ligase/repressor BirA n=1 Tax=Halopseudomonas litoralis TaxID=797277 RepID=A0A1H1XRT6_9GAMM|nr:biotin--[acetyl-CoA-carboxylase] ligase [Halopseudomonas litoralis]SDT11964.1 BirA family transcriptional regulator, biotin operon repressor / biotin-[acetyl-CoA-carboxylase] ligase [Halopseudomonas litoralis]